MSISSSVGISRSVGMFGDNEAADVRVVQERLNKLMFPKRRKLIVDGVYGNKTGLAITQFQRYACGFQWPDGLVEPDRTTIRYLNDPTSATRWAMACPVADYEIDRMVNLLRSVPHTPIPVSSRSGKNLVNIQRLNTELQALKTKINQKYPNGRPDGLGVLAIITPGNVTISGLEGMSRWVTDVSKEQGAGWGVLAALGFAVVSPFIVAYGGVADTGVAYYEVFFEPEIHGDPREYDQLINNMKMLQQEIDKLDSVN